LIDPAGQHERARTPSASVQSMKTKTIAHIAEQRFVAPEALNVAAPLIGQPLARPIRRALAMGVDLGVVALLSGVSGFWLLGGLAAVVLQLRNQRAAVTKKRLWVGWSLAGLLGLLALNEAKDQWAQRYDPASIAAAAADAATDAREAAAEAAQEASETSGGSADTARKSALAAQKAASALAAVAEKLGAKVTVRNTEKGFTLEPEPAASAVAAAPADAASAALAGANQAALVAKSRISELEAKLAEAKKPKPFSLRGEFKRFIEGVGLQFGWGVVYFSLLPAWWGGQTVGKKFFGLKVVEITGKPMTVMRCLKRYGGYAAGMATGGLGFGQMLWDPNRQGIQDKAAHTVVLDLHAAPAGTSV
jgi:RDD family